MDVPYVYEYLLRMVDPAVILTLLWNGNTMEIMKKEYSVQYKFFLKNRNLKLIGNIHDYYNIKFMIPSDSVNKLINMILTITRD